MSWMQMAILCWISSAKLHHWGLVRRRALHKIDRSTVCDRLVPRSIPNGPGDETIKWLPTCLLKWRTGFLLKTSLLQTYIIKID